MSSLFNRKLNNYAERKLNLIASYTSLRDSLKEQDDEEGNLENTFNILSEWDELVYQYNAYKSYLELSKSPIPSEGLAMMKKAESLVNQIERKIPIPYLIAEVQSLAIIRRELHENAKEAGKIYIQHETSLASLPSSKRSLESSDKSRDGNLSTSSSLPSLKKPKLKQEISQTQTSTPISKNPQILSKFPRLTNWRDHTWSKEHVKCIFLGHALKSTYYDRIDTIRKLLQDRVNVFISKQLVSYLLLHYGLRSNSNNEVDTHLLKNSFDEAFRLNEEAIAARKYDGVRSHIKDSIDYLISKSDAQYGSKFRQLFVSIYGSCTEPESNYKEFENSKFSPEDLAIDTDSIQLLPNPQKFHSRFNRKRGSQTYRKRKLKNKHEYETREEEENDDEDDEEDDEDEDEDNDEDEDDEDDEDEYEDEDVFEEDYEDEEDVLVSEKDKKEKVLEGLEVKALSRQESDSVLGDKNEVEDSFIKEKNEVEDSAIKDKKEVKDSVMKDKNEVEDSVMGDENESRVKKHDEEREPTMEKDNKLVDSEPSKRVLEKKKSELYSSVEKNINSEKSDHEKLHDSPNEENLLSNPPKTVRNLPNPCSTEQRELDSAGKKTDPSSSKIIEKGEVESFGDSDLTTKPEFDHANSKGKSEVTTKQTNAQNPTVETNDDTSLMKESPEMRNNSTSKTDSSNTIMNSNDMINRDLKLIYTKNKELPGLLFKIQKYVEAKYGTTLLLSQLSERLLSMGFEVNSTSAPRRKSPYHRTALPLNSSSGKNSDCETSESKSGAQVSNNLELANSARETPTNSPVFSSSNFTPVPGSAVLGKQVDSNNVNGNVSQQKKSKSTNNNHSKRVKEVHSSKVVSPSTHVETITKTLKKVRSNKSETSGNVLPAIDVIYNTAKISTPQISSSVAYTDSLNTNTLESNIKAAISKNHRSPVFGPAVLNPDSKNTYNSSRNTITSTRNNETSASVSSFPRTSISFISNADSELKTPERENIPSSAHIWLPENSQGSLSSDSSHAQSLTNLDKLVKSLSKSNHSNIEHSNGFPAGKPETSSTKYTDDLDNSVKSAMERIPIDAPNRISLIVNFVKQTTGTNVPEIDVTRKIQELENFEDNLDDAQCQEKIRLVLGEIITNIIHSMPSDDHYQRVFETLNTGHTWTFELNKILASTVEYLAHFSTGVSPALKEIGRQHLVSICLYRMSNEGGDESLTADAIIQRLIDMRDHDVFSPAAKDLINLIVTHKF